MLLRLRSLKTHLEDLLKMEVSVDLIVLDKEVVEEDLVTEEDSIIAEVLRDSEITLEEDFRLDHSSTTRDNNYLSL
jgi:hypothetical protein